MYFINTYSPREDKVSRIKNILVWYSAQNDRIPKNHVISNTSPDLYADTYKYLLSPDDRKYLNERHCLRCLKILKIVCASLNVAIELIIIHWNLIDSTFDIVNKMLELCHENNYSSKLIRNESLSTPRSYEIWVFLWIIEHWFLSVYLQDISIMQSRLTDAMLII